MWAEIGGNFQASETQFKNDVQFSGMKTDGDAFFENAKFAEQVQFRRTNFNGLVLSDVTWPQAPAQIRMQGMKYKFIRAAQDDSQSHQKLLDLPAKWAYSADTYNTLEEFLSSEGDRTNADKAFIYGKRRERRENPNVSHWIGSVFLDLFVGYGRRTWLATIPCALLVALGCVIFSPDKMEPQRPDDAPRVYNRFWYSLGLFLPVGDLQSDTVWKPKPEHTHLRTYMRVHMLAGWILIPIVIGALTGLIK
jgi:hypothetical protein